MTIKEEKKALRNRMLEERRMLDEEEKRACDAWFCDQLWRRIGEKGHRVVHAYLPFNTEIDIYPLLQKCLDEGITVVCPKTLPKRQLENRVLQSLDELETGIMGTKHPSQPQVYSGNLDLVIVPGLAIDPHRYRLGYGGGYYDNFLVHHPEADRVGIYYAFQYVAEVPREAHDLQLDEVMLCPGKTG